jgi:hypothetical protein
MQINQYQREHEELTAFIQNLVGDSTIVVSKLLHGNHRSQVHMYLRKQPNQYTTTDNVTLFVEIEEVLPIGMNVYNPVIIQDIKRSLSKEAILDAFPEWFQ